MKRLMLAMVIVSLSGCSLVQSELDSAVELNKQYAKVATLENKVQALEAKSIKLIGESAQTEHDIAEAKAQLEIERAKLQELVQ
ncbi:hypothetical protein VPHD271_0007 [Vibrio phage D271]